MEGSTPTNGEALPTQVLIVDDYATNRKLLRATLEAEGIKVSEAVDGLEAFRFLQQNSIDAVISDILMPNMDGYRLCHELRRNDRFRKLPVVVYTNTYTSPSDRDLALNMGADEYLTKPASPADICAALRRASEHSRTRNGHRAQELGEEFVLKNYADVLIRKLEQKNGELEDARAELEKINRELDQRVKLRTAELATANQELDSFCHAVSHDLRAPLRTISGFAQLLSEKTLSGLDDEGCRFLDRIREASVRMGELIDDLLGLSQVGRSDLNVTPIDLSALARRVTDDLKERESGRNVLVVIEAEMKTRGDARLMLIVFENLLGNAWKFTGGKPDARIEVGSGRGKDGQPVYYIRDNGAGFDMKQADRLFTAFQRLHRQEDFPGTGVGLATVQRIIQRHGGRIWANAAPGEGATFFFTLKDSD